jgi:hypothetical protein
MIKTICTAVCALAILCAGSWQSRAETVAGPATLEQGSAAHASGNFSPAVRLAKDCKPDGKGCRSNEQCCSGNCQKATDQPKGTCLHGD